MSMPMNCLSTSTSTGMTNTTDMIMHWASTPVSRIPTRIGMSQWRIGTRITPTYIIGTGTGMHTESQCPGTQAMAKFYKSTDRWPENNDICDVRKLPFSRSRDVFNQGSLFRPYSAISSRLSAQAITAQTAMTRMSVSWCLTSPLQRGSATSPKRSSNRANANGMSLSSEGIVFNHKATMYKIAYADLR